MSDKRTRKVNTSSSSFPIAKHHMSSLSKGMHAQFEDLIPLESTLADTTSPS
jgi:hypothetical protein